MSDVSAIDHGTAVHAASAAHAYVRTVVLPAVAPGVTAPSPPGSPVPPSANPALVSVRLISFNDLHGKLGDSDDVEDGVEMGGAASLAGHINALRAESPGGDIVLSAGDAIGAAPPESSLLHHESTIAVLDAMGVDVSTVGNHEWDRGFRETIRVLLGNKAAQRIKGPDLKMDTTGQRHLSKNWTGAKHPFISANIIDKRTGKPVFKPYRIIEVDGVKIAIIGAVTGNLKNVTVARGIPNLRVIDPAKAVNQYVPEIRAQGVEAIVMLTHEGGNETAPGSGKLTGEIVRISKQLDPAVDAIVSGHTHQQYAAKVGNRWITQAGHQASALGVIDLQIDRSTGDVVNATAKTVVNDEDAVPPDPKVAKMVARFEKMVAPLTERPISRLPGPVSKTYAKGGMESPMGTLIAEAQRMHAGAQIGLMNSGGVRDDIDRGGVVRWGELYEVQPFGNRLLLLEMTGAQIIRVLEQMFLGRDRPEFLQLAGIRVTIDMRRPPGKRIVKITLDDGSRFDPKKAYKVAANDFIAKGGDGYTEFSRAKILKDVSSDLEALTAYLEAGHPVPIKPIGRYRLIGGPAPKAGH